jgi:hypothetical protein
VINRFLAFFGCVVAAVMLLAAVSSCRPATKPADTKGPALPAAKQNQSDAPEPTQQAGSSGGWHEVESKPDARKSAPLTGKPILVGVGHPDVWFELKTTASKESDLPRATKAYIKIQDPGVYDFYAEYSGEYEPQGSALVLAPKPPKPETPGMLIRWERLNKTVVSAKFEAHRSLVGTTSFNGSHAVMLRKMGFEALVPKEAITLAPQTNVTGAWRIHVVRIGAKWNEEEKDQLDLDNPPPESTAPDGYDEYDGSDDSEGYGGSRGNSCA